MSNAYKRISSRGTSHVRNPYLADIGCSSSTQTHIYRT